MTFCIVYPRVGKLPLAKKDKGCRAVAEGHIIDTKAPSERPAAEATSTGRPAPLKN